MKLLDIPIRRFQAETPLSRDTYLFLPLNNKHIRIGTAGESIPEPLLSRILSKGHTHLRIDEDTEVDPETFMVHLIASSGQETQDSASESSHPPIAEVETETRFSPSPEEFAATEVKAEAFEPAPESRHQHDPAVAEEESRFQPGEDKPEGSQRFSADREEKDQFFKNFAAEKQQLPAVVRLQSRLAENSEDDSSPDLTSEKDQALKEAKTVILSSKISEQIISLSEQARRAEPGLRDSLRGQIRSLKAAMEQVDSGDLSIESDADSETLEEITSITESLASASRSEQVTDIAERLSAHALTRELAQSALTELDSDRELSRSSSSRDMPATVSRLAAYLGHSLGYTNVDFLADLACGAIAHFAKKEGTPFDEEQLPSLAKRIIAADEPANEDIIADGKDILQFLDAYIEDKECDRGHRDLMKKIFDRTAVEFSEKGNGPSLWNIKKWSSFVERGPTMDSHSICTRASAKALKCSRSAFR